MPPEPRATASRCDRIWWGAGTRASAEWTAEQGMNLMSSTLPDQLIEQLAQDEAIAAAEPPALGAVSHGAAHAVGLEAGRRRDR